MNESVLHSAAKAGDDGAVPGNALRPAAPPRVSIGLPVYNGERYLRLAIDSLLAQTFTDFELVISDNASSDASEAICREYAARDPRVRYYRNARNIGGSRNHNRVVELSVGEYFVMGAHDDLREPDYLRSTVEVLDADPSCVICFTRTRWIDEEGGPLPARPFDLRVDDPDPVVRFRELIRMDHMLDPTYGLMRAAILKRTPLEGQYADCDRVELAELALYGRFVQLPEVLFSRREHAAQSTKVYRSRHDRTAWFDPDAATQLVFPYFRQLREYVVTIFRVPQRAGVRLRCLQAMAEWTWKQRGQLWEDVHDGAFAIARGIIPQSMRRWLRSVLRGPQST
jgi:glycosyltransferase involved in cell wall biosynthesis